MGIYLIIALMALGLGILLSRPLFIGNYSFSSRSAHESEILRDQLDEVARDKERGLLGDGEAEAARLEISRRIIKNQSSSAYN